MRGGSKTLLAALLVLLLGTGFVACGDDSDSSDSGTTQGQAAREGYGGSSNGEADGQTESDASGSEGKSAGEGEGDSTSEGSGDFVPEQHEDSGGGSEQFRTKGGDNSVQEFGEEAATSEREEAATALHNFLDARAQGEWAAACDYLASSISSSFEELAGQAKGAKATSCAEILASLTNPAAKNLLLEEAERADVGSLRVEGDRAFLIYRGLEGDILAMPMAQEDGEWKVASLAGTPLN